MLLGGPDDAPFGLEDPDADWRPAADVPLSRLLDEYDAQCARSREIVAGFPLDHLAPERRPGEGQISVRWILHHMIEETARHNGRLDIVRELTDGVTGE